MRYSKIYALLLAAMVTAGVATTQDAAAQTSTGVTIKGSVYGGGNAADVKVNTVVNIGGGNVQGNVYGGGKIGDVGTHEQKVGDNIGNYTWTDNTGVCNVNVTSGTIGPNGDTASDDDHGNVFGGGKGDNTTFWCEKAMVYSTNVTINNGTVKGSVFGGGEIGRVETNTVVKIGDGPGVAPGGTATSAPQIKGSVFGAGKGLKTHGYSALVRGNVTLTIEGNAKVYESVYGGGELASVGKHKVKTSNDPLTPTDAPADLPVGMPYTLDGTNVGECTVNVQGYAEITKNVFGAGQGVSAEAYVYDSSFERMGMSGLEILSEADYLKFLQTLALTTDTDVNIGGHAKVKKSVYGGSENGFVQFGTDVSIQGSCEIGVSGTTSEGNVYGGGRGISGNTIAGPVSGNSAVTISGGTTYGSVYGGGAYGVVKENVTVNVTGGEVKKDVYGGGALANTNTDNWDATANSGAGGWATGMYTAATTTTPAYTNYKTVVNVLGGIIGTTETDTNGNLVNGRVFGGGLGDANTPAYVYGDVKVNLNGLEASDYVAAAHSNYVQAVAGSGTSTTDHYELKTTTTGEAPNTTTTYATGAIVNSVFAANNLNGTPKGNATLHVFATQNRDGEHSKINQKYPIPSETNNVTASVYDVKAVYGGGNLANYVPVYDQSTGVTAFKTQVIIEGCSLTSIETVYGGGNAAAVPETNVTVKSTYEIGYVFGGGDGHGDGNPGADVGTPDHGTTIYGTGNANTLLEGGVIHEVYGGSNQKGIIKGSLNQTTNPKNPTDPDCCELVVDKIVGAGKYADIDGDVIMTLSCQPSTKVPLLFAGADEANVNGNITLNITNGNFGKVFGGNNLRGAVKGKITVNVEETGCQPIKIDELYLGGNEAAYSIYGYYKSEDIQTETGKKILKPRTSATDSRLPVKHDGTEYTSISEFTNYAQPELNIISCTYIGNVFGGGLGSGAYMYANPTVNINMIPGKYATSIDHDGDNNADNNAHALGHIGDVYGGGNQAAVNGSTTVNIGTAGTVTMTSANGEPVVNDADKTKTVEGARITGNVYGGGNQADVTGNTHINIGTQAYTGSGFEGVLVQGNVFGAGKGVETDANKAKVGGNTTVLISGGQIDQNVYGGGQMASVGDADEVKGDVTDSYPFGYKTGTARVTINGTASLGTNTNCMGEHGYGYVYGSGLGMAGYPDLAYVKNTIVTIGGTTNSDNPAVRGSVFGSGENGHVRHDTKVYVKSGTVGTPLTTYVVKDENGLAIKDYKNENDSTIVEYAETEGSGVTVFRGNVYGGGRGIDKNNSSHYSQTSGLVAGNTLVEVSGGTIYHGVFGGGSLASVGTTLENGDHAANTGKATVNIKGGIIGDNTPKSDSKSYAGINNGHVYGSGRGVAAGAGTEYVNLAFVHDTEVNIYGADTEKGYAGATIYGCVFGGGANGHVKDDTNVNIYGGTIGTPLTDEEHAEINGEGMTIYRGNVYGGGRGVDQFTDNDGTRFSTTAGVVYGNATVNISGGRIYHDVYGAGSMASVGTITEAVADGILDYLEGTYVEGTGTTTVNVSGGIIGDTGFNDGRVYGAGRGATGQRTSRVAHMEYVNNAFVNISGTADIRGCVFGGGENGHVKNNTKVTISGGVIGTELTEAETTFNTDGTGTILYRGNVYGGGRGVDHITELGKTLSYTAGRVYGNTEVEVTDGTIRHAVYGGGSLASVGKYTVAANDSITALISGGIAKVTISGGHIGNLKADGTNSYNPGKNNGNVFGSCRGMVADNEDAQYSKMAFVDSTCVTINEGADIRGCVFGGGENGHVFDDTGVYINGGIIGEPFTTEGENAETAINETTGANASGHHLYRGNVYGGGRGVDKVGEGNNEHLSATAGRVYGNTYVEVSGGTIRHNVFGGGSLASVGTFTTDKDAEYSHTTSVWSKGGDTHVTISGGIIGQSGTNNGFVFGSGRGMAATSADAHKYAQMAFVNNTYVTIGGGTVKGSVFGSGENGHVHNNTLVTVNGGTIGSAGCTKFAGNIYGGGRGVDGNADSQMSSTAGWVGGTTSVNITGGQIYHDVYGGGSMGSVGVSTEDNTGEVTVLVNGGTVGVAGETGYGNVYGGGRGMAGDAYANLAFVKRTFVTIKNDSTSGVRQAHVFGNVYGGGNAGHVRRGTTVTLASGNVDGNMYGGGRGSAESETAGLVHHNVRVYMNGGTVGKNVYGGGAIANTNIHDKDNTEEAENCPSDPKEECYTKVELNGGLIKGDAYGGGEGEFWEPTEDNKETYMTDTTQPLYNQQYWNATAKAEYAKHAAIVYGDVTVTLDGTAFATTTEKDSKNNDVPNSGRIFGCNNINGTPKGSVKVHVKRTIPVNDDGNTRTRAKGNYEVEAVYGGGNQSAYVPADLENNKTEVIIDGCDRTSIRQVYGGGNAACTPSTSVTVNGTFEVEELFGGGNGLDNILINGVEMPNPGANVGYKNYSEYYKDGTIWKVRDKAAYDTKDERKAATDPVTGIVYGTGVATVNVFGGLVHRVFGGSNTKGNVRQTALTLLDESGGCEFCVDEAYGGGKSAEMDAEAKLLMACIPGLQAAYGGAEEADVHGNVTLNITNGTFDRVFGGNNLSGTISGSITVNIEEIGCRPIKIGELYGGGNEAGYSVYGYNADGTPKESGTKLYDDPQVNVKSFTSIGKVFGGGYGERATLVGNPTVNVNEIYGRYYNDEVSVVGENAETPNHYPIPSHAKGKMGAISEVFGGGNAAKVIGNTTVNIATAAEVYIVKEVTAGANLPAGCYTRSGEGTTANPFVYTEATGTASATVTYYEKETVLGADIRGNVYGGGNNAEVTGATNVTIGKHIE